MKMPSLKWRARSAARGAVLRTEIAKNLLERLIRGVLRSTNREIGLRSGL